MDDATIRARLKQWIRDHSKAPTVELADNTPILDKGILSSLDIVELVLFIESLRGDQVDPDALGPDAFQSLAPVLKGLVLDR